MKESIDLISLDVIDIEGYRCLPFFWSSITNEFGYYNSKQHLHQWGKLLGLEIKLPLENGAFLPCLWLLLGDRDSVSSHVETLFGLYMKHSKNIEFKYYKDNVLYTYVFTPFSILTHLEPYSKENMYYRIGAEMNYTIGISGKKKIHFDWKCRTYPHPISDSMKQFVANILCFFNFEDCYLDGNLHHFPNKVPSCDIASLSEYQKMIIQTK